MTITIGHHSFDLADYDARGDILHLRASGAESEGSTYGTPEGHAVSFDADGTVVGITIVNAKWLLERDGKITITAPAGSRPMRRNSRRRSALGRRVSV